jgi:integrase
MVDVTHEGKRRTATCDSLDEAKAKQIELRHLLITGQTPPPTARQGKITLGDAVRYTKRHHWRGKKSEGKLGRNAEHAVEFMGEDTPLVDVTRARIDEWVEHLMEIGNSNSTVNRKLASLSSVFTVMIEAGKIEHRPKMPRKREYAGRIRYLTASEEQELLAWLRNSGYEDVADFVVLLLDTGLRTGEALDLQPRDFAPETRMISQWRTKGDLPRSVPVTGRVQEIIEGRIKLTEGRTSRLFPFPRSRLRYGWERARSHMGLADDPQFVPHACRHTFCSRLVQRGVGLRTVQELAGHKTIGVTMRYAHLAPENLTAAIRVLEPAGDKVPCSPTVAATVAAEG